MYLISRMSLTAAVRQITLCFWLLAGPKRLLTLMHIYLKPEQNQFPLREKVHQSEWRFRKISINVSCDVKHI